MIASVILLAEEGTKETINPVLPVANEIVWGAIFFFSLLILMWKVCLPPVKKAMRKREEQILADETAAEKAKAEAEQVRRDYDTTLAEARAEAARIIDEARNAAETYRGELVASAEAQAAVARKDAMAEVDAQRDTALASISGDVAQMATLAASKVVGTSLDVSAQQGIVSDYISRSSGKKR